MRQFAYLFATTALLTTTACSSLNAPLSSDFGDATKANFVANVDDARPMLGDPTPDARVIDGAIDRYQQDEVKRPDTPASYTPGATGGGEEE